MFTFRNRLCFETHLVDYYYFYVTCSIINIIAIILLYFSNMKEYKNSLYIAMFGTIIFDFSMALYTDSLCKIIESSAQINDDEVNIAIAIISKNYPSLTTILEIIMPFCDIINFLLFPSICLYNSYGFDFTKSYENQSEEIFPFIGLGMLFLVLMILAASIVAGIWNLLEYTYTIFDRTTTRKFRLMKASYVKDKQTDNEYKL